jgi:uncharacterized membrane protein
MAAVLPSILLACHPGSSENGVSDGSGHTGNFDAIRADETIKLIGTEPFWGGAVEAGKLTYTTPENQAGETIAVKRFAGNNGLGFSGSLDSKPFDLTVTPGECSDGMSDRRFPFTATLRIGDEQRSGCAWTDRTPFAGPANP